MQGPNVALEHIASLIRAGVLLLPWVASWVSRAAQVETVVALDQRVRPRLTTASATA